MCGAIAPLPNMPYWRGAQLKKSQGQLTLPYPTLPARIQSLVPPPVFMKRWSMYHSMKDEMQYLRKNHNVLKPFVRVIQLPPGVE
jgi:hypothetical protein